MTVISNFRLNTHFTALKQLPASYSGGFNIATRSIPAYQLGTLLGSTVINVPAGVYVENIITRTSMDGNKNHLTPQFFIAPEDRGYFYVAVNQIANDKYELTARIDNFSNSPLNIPASTVSALLRLAIAPF